MTWAAMYPNETESALADRAAHPRALPQPEPGIWSKAGALVSAPYTGFARALNESARVAYRVTHWQPDIEPLFDLRKIGVDTDAIAKGRRLRDEEADQAMRSAAEFWTPDAATASWASNFLHEGSRILTKVGAYSAFGGAPGAIAGTGLDEGATNYLSMRDRGVDPSTAAKVGATHGAVMAASVALPVVGRTGLQTAGLVAAGGPGAFVGEQILSRNILERAGYPDIAREFDPWDTAGLLTSLVPGAAMGTAVHLARGRRTKAAPQVTEADQLQALADTPEAVEAAHVQYRQDVTEANMLAAPDDLAARGDHQRALAEASRALDEGRPMELGDIRVDPVRAEAAVQEMQQRIEAARAVDVIDDSAPPPVRFEPGSLERPDVRAAREAWAAEMLDGRPRGKGDPGTHSAAVQNLLVGLRETRHNADAGVELLAEYSRRADSYGPGNLADVAADVVEELRAGALRRALVSEEPLSLFEAAERLISRRPDLPVRLDENGRAIAAESVLRTERDASRRELRESTRAVEVALECLLRLGD